MERAVSDVRRATRSTTSSTAFSVPCRNAVDDVLSGKSGLKRFYVGQVEATLIGAGIHAAAPARNMGNPPPRIHDEADEWSIAAGGKRRDRLRKELHAGHRYDGLASVPFCHVRQLT